MSFCSNSTASYLFVVINFWILVFVNSIYGVTQRGECIVRGASYLYQTVLRNSQVTTHWNVKNSFMTYIFQKMHFLYNKHTWLHYWNLIITFINNVFLSKGIIIISFRCVGVTCLVTMITDYFRAQPKPRAVTLEPNLRNRQWKLGSRFIRTAQSCCGLERRVVRVGISVRFHSDCVAARVSMYGSGGSKKNWWSSQGRLL